MRRRRRRRRPALALDQAPDVFILRVLLEETGEMFQVAHCHSDMTVRELKEELELVVGVPLDLQRLQYLDQGVLMDDTTLKFHDVVPGGIISLCIWHYDGWTELILAAVEGDLSKLSCLAVDEDSVYQTANSKHLGGERRKEWICQRAFVALYITSHRGHPDAVQHLLEHGADCLQRTPMGRTALHAAGAMGRLDCINLLLNYGASVTDKDARGETPMSIARRMNRRHSERRMFLFYWMTKSGTTDPKKLLAHQVSHRVKGSAELRMEEQVTKPRGDLGGQAPGGSPAPPSVGRALPPGGAAARCRLKGAGAAASRCRSETADQLWAPATSFDPD
ncbi:ankyrin repeat domain-containing protein 60 [Lynx canadensis]|uniref:ankyrin repeat domain-containing protein 60 n=1 Tax=Lynx canadensis TaxID=61383 RepID=UPI0011B07974|nr:ankyrin repeat domain-containing protein 60 [Lynx canadensis]